MYVDSALKNFLPAVTFFYWYEYQYTFQSNNSTHSGRWSNRTTSICPQGYRTQTLNIKFRKNHFGSLRTSHLKICALKTFLKWKHIFQNPYREKVTKIWFGYENIPRRKFHPKNIFTRILSNNQNFFKALILRWVWIWEGIKKRLAVNFSKV